MYFQNVINTSVTRGHNCNRIIMIIISLKIKTKKCLLFLKEGYVDSGYR
jgi:hypothetical protein